MLLVEIIIHKHIMSKSEIEKTASIYQMGFILREARKKVHLTQEQLAQRVGSNRSYISKIENNATHISLDTLVKIVEKGLGGHVDINIVI